MTNSRKMDDKENSSINNFDFSLICEYFSSLKRQGPGSKESTIRALSFLPELGNDSKIADLGCGTGSSALLLAQYTKARITALDLFPDFINKVNVSSAKLGLSQRVDAIIGSMDNMPFDKQQFDVIWSEGAIYNVGFERGLREWRQYIKENGYIAVTESSWLTDERPKEIEDFWIDAYPEMDTVSNKISVMQKCGYRLIAAFVLPDECWTKEFYEPQAEAQRLFLECHPENSVADELVKNQRHEAELYSKYNKYYGYVWYIGQKI